MDYCDVFIPKCLLDKVHAEEGKRINLFHTILQKQILILLLQHYVKKYQGVTH